MGGMQYPLPRCTHQYLVEIFFRVGCCRSGLNGAEPLTYNELANYSLVSGCSLSSWEAEAIISMSCAFCSAIKDKDSATPYPNLTKEIIEMNRAAIAAKMAKK